jgi:hypothetical protein
MGPTLEKKSKQPSLDDLKMIDDFNHLPIDKKLE